MHIDLKQLKPNPFRDMEVDPIREDRVNLLKESINYHGFWGGVVVRNHGGELQICAGHHRVAAAILCDITSAEIFVRPNCSDEEAIKIYAVENATQRGVESSMIAQAGFVAAAVKILAMKTLLGEQTVAFSEEASSGKVHGTSESKARNVLENIAVIQGNLLSDKGIGHELIFETFKGISGITEQTVKDHLDNLKATVHYSRIVTQVAEDIWNTIETEIVVMETQADQREREYEKALTKAKGDVAKREKLRTAQRKAKGIDAMKKAALVKTEQRAAIVLKKQAEIHPTLSEGAIGQFKNPSQVKAFREETKRLRVPIGDQDQLAIAIVTAAKAQGEPPTAKFIKEHLDKFVKNPNSLPTPEMEVTLIQTVQTISSVIRRNSDTLEKFINNQASISESVKTNAAQLLRDEGGYLLSCANMFDI
jgi:ParB-like chromosome segregation protein Spo0J